MILVLPGEIAVPLPDRVEAARNEISAWAERTGNNIEDVAYRAGGRVISAGQRDKNLRALGFINTTEPSIEFSNELFKQSTGGRLTIEQSQQEFFNKTGKEITGETIETLYTDEFKAREILMNNPAIHKTYREILVQHPVS